MKKVTFCVLTAVLMLSSLISSASELDPAVLKNADELSFDLGLDQNLLGAEPQMTLLDRPPVFDPPRRRPAPPPYRPVPPPHRPEPPRYPYPPRPVPPPSASVVCYAENDYREVFWASGYYPRLVQDHAMDLCYRYSRYCYAMGCEYRSW